MKKIIIFVMLLFLCPFCVKAYITDTSSNVINNFTVAELKEVTYEYYYLDENDNEVQVQNSNTNNVFVGSQISINDTLTSLDCNNIKHYVNGSLYNGSTYTITGDTTIKEVCELNRYTITYNLNNGTLNNPKTTYTSMTETFDLPTPTRNGYAFDGWCNGNTNCNNPSKPYTVTKGSIGNITVRAQWHQATRYRVTYSGDTRYYSHSPSGNNVYAYEGETFETDITLNDSDYSISSVTITMGGRTLNESQYTYTGSGVNYHLSIPNVSGAITINIQVNTSGGGGCLVEGTEILLWDGTTKKIEDITYNDLLKVWNYETGTYGYEYPAWIEKEGTIGEYTKVTFSDGTVLRIAKDHRLFSKRLNKYVNINSGDLKVGDKVVSLKDGIGYVTVESIEQVNEEVKYYHIITERYFNMIAEGLLTTYEIDDDVSSNYKGFGENLVWNNTTPEEQKLSYDEFINMFGYVDKYLYKTLKLEDFKYAIDNGLIDLEAISSIVKTYMFGNDYKVLPPKDSDGVYLWMVTTSDDENPNDIVHQKRDSSVYIVPTPKNSNGFKYWYNHSDNKRYQPGDMVEVDSSMYFEAVYGEPEVVEETEEPIEETQEVEETIEDVSTEPVLGETIMDPIKDDPEEE